jgi:colicin import membrane protein
VPRVTPPPPPKVVPTPAPKPEIALKKVEKKPEPKIEPKVEAKPVPKAEPKKRDDEKLARQQAEDAARREQREAERKRETAEKEAKAAADKEAAEKASAARAAAAREIQKYINGIYGRVWARVAVPPDIQGSPEAVFEVSLFPGGELANVVMRKSSGNAAYDAAVERAIRQAQPFVVPTGDLFHGNFRPVTLSFRPR